MVEIRVKFGVRVELKRFYAAGKLHTEFE